VADTVVNICTILSITTESKRTRTTANCVAVLEACHVGVAGVNGTVLDFNITVRTSKTDVAVTSVVVEKVNANSVPARRRKAVVDVLFAFYSSITSWTDTYETVDFIKTHSMNAWR